MCERSIINPEENNNIPKDHLLKASGIAFSAASAMDYPSFRKDETFKATLKEFYPHITPQQEQESLFLFSANSLHLQSTPPVNIKTFKDPTFSEQTMTGTYIRSGYASFSLSMDEYMKLAHDEEYRQKLKGDPKMRSEYYSFKELLKEIGPKTGFEGLMAMVERDPLAEEFVHLIREELKDFAP